MENHHQVYLVFAEYCFQAIREGRGRYSAKAIIEIMRWNRRDIGKISNMATTYLALKFMEQHPQHATLFISTKRKTEE
ncbi:hypothetical protein ABIB99_008463 [Bradyrhizobium sp. LA6.1]|uniref:hypothetical protein n=1 Tax=Bradyrhizobium sp. LA6.1 TaxID=3156378 RepID=UPI00339297B3